MSTDTEQWWTDEELADSLVGLAKNLDEIQAILNEVDTSNFPIASISRIAYLIGYGRTRLLSLARDRGWMPDDG